MKPGLYEQVINRLLDIRLGDKKYKVETEPIEKEESPKILSKYLAEILEKGLSNLKDRPLVHLYLSGGLQRGVGVVNLKKSVLLFLNDKLY